jgi:hypothetical protein
MRPFALGVVALALAASPALAQPDTEPPVLVDFDFNPKSVDVTSGPAVECSEPIRYNQAKRREGARALSVHLHYGLVPVPARGHG